jgi:hypothetical protein
MEAKRPVRVHGGVPNDIRVLLRHFRRLLASQEVQVDDAADRVVFQILCARWILVHENLHGVAVEQEDAMRSLVATVVKVDWVSAVEVGLLGNVGRLRVEQNSPIHGGEAERVAVLAHAVDVRLLGKSGAPSDILLFKDQLTGSGVEQHFTISLAFDGKRERLLYNVKLQSGA